MKRKGFTLIELLAVIVVLAIIALIAVPLVINIIKKADKNAFKDSAYGILKAGNLYYSRKEMNGEVLKNTKFSFPDNIEGLDISNSHLINGEMKITLNGDISFALTNGKYCARKKYDNNEIIVDENIDTCEIPWIMKSDNECVEDVDSLCENGTKVLVKANELETYNFYVINDTGSKLTLIMDRNLGKKVPWISKEDYELVGGTNWGDSGNNEKGPLTAIKQLENTTAGWENIEEYNYTLIYSELYQPIERMNVRARMLMYDEAKKLGCTTVGGSCPSYLKENLSTNVLEAPNGYWLGSSDLYQNYFSYRILSYGNMGSSYVSDSAHYGVRPVIEIPKFL